MSNVSPHSILSAMSQHTKPPPLPRSGVLRGIIAGAALLVLLWLVATVVEPYLIEAAMSPTDFGTIREARRSAAGWANSNIWLGAEALCISVALFAGFLSRRLSSRRSWAAPLALFVACVLYVFFAQFPVTKSPWRIALWSFGLPLGLLFGAWFG